MSSHNAPCAHRGSLHSSSSKFFLPVTWCRKSKRGSVFLPNRITLRRGYLPRGAALGGAAMRKQNHSIPPVFKHNGRLNNSVAPRPRRKCSNSQKHGVFAEPLILPGEDPREFEALHAALIEEWTPSGPSEQSRVFGMADAEWRKLRSRRIVQAKAIGNSLRPDHPAFDETRGLIAFGNFLWHEPETAFAEYASNLLRTDKIEYLGAKFPRENFESIEESAVAVVKEVQSVLLPATPGFARLDPDKLDPATEALRTEIIKMRSFVTTIHARNFLDDDLDQQERLDARIAIEEGARRNKDSETGASTNIKRR